MNNWPIYGPDGIPVTATAASTATLVGTDTSRIQAEDVFIDNPGPNDVYAKAGDASAVATLTSVRVLPYSMQPFRKAPGNTHIALRTATGNQAVVIHVGAGS